MEIPAWKYVHIYFFNITLQTIPHKENIIKPLPLDFLDCASRVEGMHFDEFLFT
jgi:hypothetical protein